MSPAERRESPLFVKTQDYVLWLFRHTARFPKQYRHTLTQRIEQGALEFQRCLGRRLLMQDLSALGQADLELWHLRSLLRLAHELGFFPTNSVEYSARSLQELGRLLGAWRQKEGKRT